MPRWKDADAPDSVMDDLLGPPREDEGFAAALAAHTRTTAQTSVHPGVRKSYSRPPHPTTAYLSKPKRSRRNDTKRTSRVPNALMDPEAWDDSALVSAWEEAEKEYRIYHSMDGEIKEKERSMDKEEETKTDKGDEEERPLLPSQDDSEAKVDNSTDPAAQDKQEPTVQDSSEPEREHEPHEPPSSTQPPTILPMAPPIDPSQLGDESLSNMLMAWYYAGYYTAQFQARRGGGDE
ncbi:MAG: hypothetical protein DHS80DRAFT_29529 [Piptocephalis tieghemiana]|nr:MAG: hypothetical protein DHS80DRAFT_29529 [Piptocephalis tieghemiana]